MRVTGSRRARWPVLEVDGRIVWMQGVELEPQGGIEVAAGPLQGTACEADCSESRASKASGKH
jgi:hypothetical protein